MNMILLECMINRLLHGKFIPPRDCLGFSWWCSMPYGFCNVLFDIPFVLPIELAKQYACSSNQGITIRHYK